MPAVKLDDNKESPEEVAQKLKDLGKHPAHSAGGRRIPDHTRHKTAGNARTVRTSTTDALDPHPDAPNESKSEPTSPKLKGDMYHDPKKIVPSQKKFYKADRQYNQPREATCNHNKMGN
eukprot:132465_1